MQNLELGTYEGHVIKVNDGMLNLTNMWKACGGNMINKPYEWLRHDNVSEFMAAFKKKEKAGQARHFIKTVTGRHGGTFAHPVIGLAYAKYLSPEFHIWCNEKLLESGLMEVSDGELLVKLGQDGLPVEQSGLTHKRRHLRYQFLGALTPPDRGAACQNQP